MVAWQQRLVQRVQGVVRVRGEAEAQVDALLHRGQELGHGQLHLGRHGVRLDVGREEAALAALTQRITLELCGLFF